MQIAIPLVIVIVVVLLVFAGLMANARRRADRIEDLQQSDVDMLRYRVPEGHDPAPVLAALQKKGFEAVPDARRMDRNDILIPCHEGKDRHREHVRAVIAGVDAINMDGDPAGMPGDPAPVRAVRFADE